MQRFSGSWSNRSAMIFILAVACGALYFVIHPINTSGESGVQLARVMMGGIVMLIGIPGLIALVESFTVYRVDEEGVSRSGWNGLQRMTFREVANVAATGQRDSTLVFSDISGRKLRVYVGVLSTGAQYALREVLRPHLAPIMDRQRNELGRLGKEYPASRQAGVACMIVVAMAGFVVAGILAIPSNPSDKPFIYILAAIFGLMGLGMLAFGVHTLTKVYSLTAGGITERSALKTVDIPFHSVTSVETRHVTSNKGGSFDLAVITGASSKDKITMNSRMPDYPLLLDFVRLHVDSSAIVPSTPAGAISPQAARAQLVANLTIGVILVVMTMVAGAYMISQANYRLARYRVEDTEGRVTNGVVTGQRYTGGKTTHYYIDYRFAVGDATIKSTSPVTWSDYATLPADTAVKVIYVPGDPNNCRIRQSSGPEDAARSIQGAYILMGIGVAAALMISAGSIASRFKKLPRSRRIV